MDEREYEIARKKEETRQDLYEKIFWLVFWFLVIGGCTITEIATQ